MSGAGRVDALFVGAESEGPLRPVERVWARAGRGLDGDRYQLDAGTFSDGGRGGRDLTLIQAEALEALEREHGIALGPGQSRRNVVTRGIDLNALVGKRFRVGEVECLGRRLCDPCRHLEQLTVQGVLRGLAGRGGLRADVLGDGPLAVGDAIVEL